MHSIFHSPPQVHLPTAPHTTPSPHPTPSPHGCPHPISHLTCKLPGTSSLLRVRCIISEWTQTWKSPTVCVFGEGCLISAGICCLFGGPVFERSQEFRLINTAGPVFYRIALLLSFFQPSLIQKQKSAASVHWLGTNISTWFFQLFVESFRGQSW